MISPTLAFVLCFAQSVTPGGPVTTTGTAIARPAVGGRLEYKEGQRILNVWGTHYEMGYAHGWLLGDKIMELLEGYGLQVLMDPVAYETVYLPLAQYLFTIDPRFQEELEGMLDGMVAGGTDVFVEDLNRDLTYWDLFCMNHVAELGQFGCSVTFGWGAATAADPELSGGSAFVRDLDWGPDPTGFLNTESVIITFDSSLPDEQPFVSIAWPGVVSVLTAVNEDGVAASVNYGNHQDTGTGLPQHYTGIGFSLRTGLERRDFDGDGFENHFDVHQAASSVNTYASFEISLLSPYPVPGRPGAGAGGVFEVNFFGHVLRDSSNNMDYAPQLASMDLLAVTNHHRLLYSPVYCPRYYAQVSLLAIDFAVDTQELWDIESAIGYAGTHHMVCFRPNLMDMYVAFNETFLGAANSRRVHYAWNELYPNH